MLMMSGCTGNGSKFQLWPWGKQTATGPSHSMFGNPHTPTTSTPPLTKRGKADMQMTVAQSLERKGNYESAQEGYTKVVENDPLRADAWHRLAVVNDHQGQHSEAVRCYQEAIKRDPRNANVHCDLGYSLYLQRRWSEAERELRTAVELKPQLTRAHNNLGMVLARNERYEEAMQEFNLAGCKESESRLNLAHAMLLEQHTQEAYQQCDSAMASQDITEEVRKKINTIRTYAATPPQPEIQPVTHLQP